MITKYCTKRDINGNTYILEVDTDKRTFTKNPADFFMEYGAKITPCGIGYKISY